MSALKLPPIDSSLPKPRILLWSLRNIQNFVYNACLFEFEDVVAQSDLVHFAIAPKFNRIERSLNKVFRETTQRMKPAMHFNPYGRSIRLEQEYDVFFTVLDFPKSILTINAIKNRKQRCKLSVCYIMEVWKSDLPTLRNYLEFFKDFDAIFLGHSGIVDEVAKIIQRPCFYMPPGVDTLKLYPDFSQPREIDICNLGRRSSVTHQALLEMVERQSDLTYHYDQYSSKKKKASARCNDFPAHRAKTVKLLQNSRYFFVNYSKFNQPEKVRNQREFGYRFFEGAAAGNIMIGCPPNTPAFQENFDWDNAVIPINFDEPTIAELINSLDADKEELHRIQVNNVVNALQRHDWVYRWQVILNQIGITPDPALDARIQQLRASAQDCQKPETAM